MKKLLTRLAWKWCVKHCCEIEQTVSIRKYAGENDNTGIFVFYNKNGKYRLTNHELFLIGALLEFSKSTNKLNES